jgi:hypothetical protein
VTSDGECAVGTGVLTVDQCLEVSWLRLLEDSVSDGTEVILDTLGHF